MNGLIDDETIGGLLPLQNGGAKIFLRRLAADTESNNPMKRGEGDQEFKKGIMWIGRGGEKKRSMTHESEDSAWLDIVRRTTDD